LTAEARKRREVRSQRNNLCTSAEEILRLGSRYLRDEGLQRFFQTADRFSMNASTPSFMSSVRANWSM
jgi:hypothetical protein